MISPGQLKRIKLLEAAMKKVGKALQDEGDGHFLRLQMKRVKRIFKDGICFDDQAKFYDIISNLNILEKKICDEKAKRQAASAPTDP